jgi:hypothetical protein
MANYSDVHYNILADYLGETIVDVVLVIDFNNRTHYDDSDAETDIMDYQDHLDDQGHQDHQEDQDNQGDADWEYLMNNINELGGLLNPDHDYSGSDFEPDPSDLADDDDVSSISDVTDPEVIFGDAHNNDEVDTKTSPQELSPEVVQEEDESNEPDLSGDSDEVMWTYVDSEIDTLPEDSATYQLLEAIARAHAGR